MFLTLVSVLLSSLKASSTVTHSPLTTNNRMDMEWYTVLTISGCLFLIAWALNQRKKHHSELKNQIPNGYKVFHSSVYGGYIARWFDGTFWRDINMVGNAEGMTECNQSYEEAVSLCLKHKQKYEERKELIRSGLVGFKNTVEYREYYAHNQKEKALIR
jgi:hypothetical protein